MKLTDFAKKIEECLIKDKDFAVQNLPDGTKVLTCRVEKYYFTKYGQTLKKDLKRKKK